MRRRVCREKGKEGGEGVGERRGEPNTEAGSGDRSALSAWLLLKLLLKLFPLWLSPHGLPMLMLVALSCEEEEEDRPIRLIPPWPPLPMPPPRLLLPRRWEITRGR